MPTSASVAIGTPAFIAPEQVRGTVTEATDVFALGHLGSFAATGHSAWRRFGQQPGAPCHEREAGTASWVSERLRPDPGS
jgi:serine/threonine protein kinase